MPDYPVMENPESSWHDYFEASKDKPLHPLYLELDRLLPNVGRALELGCGVGTGVLHLARWGFQVVAVDALEEPLEILERRLDERTKDLVEIRQSRIEDLRLSESEYDLIVAGFTLFFVEADMLEVVWQRVTSWLKPSGVFMGQFLGPADSWASKGYTVQTQEEIQTLLQGFEILHYEHVVREGGVVQGNSKHWDVTHVIAKMS